MEEHNESAAPKKLTLDPEQVAYWYFRLNGFLTTVNFLVHSEEGMAVRTDVDILAVRFPHREELLNNPMRDEPHFLERPKPYIAIAEVKQDRCALNGPWTRRGDENMQRVLAAIGVIPSEERDTAARALYEKGVYENELYYVTLCCLGNRANEHWLKTYPRVPQILWADVGNFFYQRFVAYRDQKRANRQWNETGRLLYSLACSNDQVSFMQIFLTAIASHTNEPA